MTAAEVLAVFNEAERTMGITYELTESDHAAVAIWRQLVPESLDHLVKGKHEIDGYPVLDEQAFEQLFQVKLKRTRHHLGLGNIFQYSL